jgi:salicylate hydroxylase
MGGLATALALAKEGFTNIDVYETASNLGFVGAGIQLAPNMARVLSKLGCWDEIEREAVDLKSTSIRRAFPPMRWQKYHLLTYAEGDTNEELGHVDLLYIRETYGFPHMVGHRTSLAGGLYEACKKEKGIKFHFSTAAEKLDSFGPKPVLRLKPRDGESYTIEPEVVLASDGVKSVIRSQLLSEIGVHAEVEDTGQAAYRIVLKREEMQDDPELLELIDAERVTRWIGEKRHIIAYPVSNKTLYNISTVQPDTNFAAAPSATYTTKGSKTSMMEIFGDFCPMTKRMLDLVPNDEVCEWKLRVHAPLPTWVHGSVALLGDACHPTLPHLAQGAALAIEDAGVLGTVLAQLPDRSPESINKTLRVYEQLRKERAETLVALAAASGRSLHLGDGAAKAERDKQFAALKASGGKAPVPDKWADADVQKKIYGHDCMQVAKDSFEELYAKL